MKVYLYAAMALALAACGENAKPAAETAATPAPEIRASFQDIMLSIVDPAADGIWNSLGVSYDETGEHRREPKTDEEWLALRRHAVALAEAPNLLAMEGRPLVNPGATIEFQKYYPPPAEIQQRIDTARPDFLQMAQALQTTAVEALAAIDMKDAAALEQAGERMDEACEACHKTFWYTEAK